MRFILVSDCQSEVKMGTYTTNKNLFMPSIGEQGWGTLVNGNFSTIDTFLKPITVSGSTYTFTGNQTGGSVSATSISNSGTLTQTGASTFTGKITGNGGIGTTSLTTSRTITSTGKITGNGGIGTTSLTTSSTITSTGKITANGGVVGKLEGFLFVKGTVGTSGDENYATCAAQTLTITASHDSSSSYLSTYINKYGITSLPKRHTWGVYTRASDLTGTTSPNISSRSLTFTIKCIKTYSSVSLNTTQTKIYYKKSTDTSWSSVSLSSAFPLATVNASATYPAINVTPGATYYFYNDSGWFTYISITGSIPAATTYKIKYATP